MDACGSGYRNAPTPDMATPAASHMQPGVTHERFVLQFLIVGLTALSKCATKCHSYLFLHEESLFGRNNRQMSSAENGRVIAKRSGGNPKPGAAQKLTIRGCTVENNITTSREDPHVQEVRGWAGRCDLELDARYDIRFRGFLV
jgi:hypothetical protein